ncbi:hypothetical protein Tco_0599409 [Tanacetum coccineum]
MSVQVLSKYSTVALSTTERRPNLVTKKKYRRKTGLQGIFDLIHERTFGRGKTKRGSSLGLSSHDVEHTVQASPRPQGQPASEYDNTDPMPPRQNVVPTARKQILHIKG